MFFPQLVFLKQMVSRESRVTVTGRRRRRRKLGVASKDIDSQVRVFQCLILCQMKPVGYLNYSLFTTLSHVFIHSLCIFHKDAL